MKKESGRLNILVQLLHGEQVQGQTCSEEAVRRALAFRFSSLPLEGGGVELARSKLMVAAAAGILPGMSAEESGQRVANHFSMFPPDSKLLEILEEVFSTPSKAPNAKKWSPRR